MNARSGWRVGGLAIAGWLAACGAETTAPPDTAGTSAPAVLSIEHDGDWFVDRAAESGLDFVHVNGMSGRFYQPEMMGPGVGLLDYDNDGDLDVYLVQGGRLGDGDPLLPPPAGQPPGDRLYRNDLEAGPGGERRLRFTDVTNEAGIAARGYGMGVAAGDYDNDGSVDLYLTRFGPNQMYRNQGDGTFADVSAETGTAGSGWSVPAAFFDYDRDGWLDLFVGNYLNYTQESHWQCFAPSGPADYCPPEVSPAQPDRLYRNLGDGTFADVTLQAGMGREFGPGLGARASDYDNDGWLDLFVANDQRENQLWINQRDGTFRNRALLWGTALGATGVAKADMGVDAGDFDNDGDEDLFVTELAGQGSTLYVNDGGMFRDQSAGRGIRAASLPYTGFGAGWLDIDNDGWLDVVAVNGTVTLDLEAYGPDNPFALQQRNQVFRNRGGARFEDVTERAGAAFALSEVSRGAAFGGRRQRRRHRRAHRQRRRAGAPARQRGGPAASLDRAPSRRPRGAAGHAGGEGGGDAAGRLDALAPRPYRWELRLGQRSTGSGRSRGVGRSAARARHLARGQRRGVGRGAGGSLHDADGRRRPATMNAPPGAVVSSMAAAAMLAVVMCAACGPLDEAGSGAEGRRAPAKDAAPPPLVLPGLAGLETGVQDQIRARHAAVLALGGGGGRFGGGARRRLRRARSAAAGGRVLPGGGGRLPERAGAGSRRGALDLLPGASVPGDRATGASRGGLPASPGSGVGQPAGAGLAGRDASRSGTARGGRAGVRPGAGRAARVGRGTGRNRARGVGARGRGAGRYLPRTGAGRRSGGDEPPLQPRHGIPGAGPAGSRGAVSAAAGKRGAGTPRPAPAAVDRPAGQRAGPRAAWVGRARRGTARRGGGGVPGRSGAGAGRSDAAAPSRRGAASSATPRGGPIWRSSPKAPGCPRR